MIYMSREESALDQVYIFIVSNDNVHNTLSFKSLYLHYNECYCLTLKLAMGIMITSATCLCLMVKISLNVC